MKLRTTLAIAALLATGSAFAAATTSTTATTPSASTHASAMPVHHSLAHCEKEAKVKKLAGDEARKFVKECRTTPAAKAS
jgi:hypothetical protein